MESVREKGQPAVEVEVAETGVQSSPAYMTISPPIFAVEAQMEGVEVRSTYSVPFLAALLL